jgi:hypothetical protein
MSKLWPEVTLSEARKRSVLTVTVLGRPVREVELKDLTLRQWGYLCRLCFPNWKDYKAFNVKARRPVTFDLAVLKESDLGSAGLTVDNVVRVCLGYMGKAMDDTKQDRKRFAQNVHDAGVKRRGGELPGRFGS